MIEIQRILDVMRHLDGLKAIIFDLDDTLYSEKEYVRSGYAVISQALSHLKDKDIEKKLWKAFEEKKSAIDEFLHSENIYTDELKQQCIELYRQHQPNIHLYEGVTEMLVQLRKRGLSIGIITDGRPEGQRAKIKALNLEKYVDKIIVTDELGGIAYRKPNEKAFVLIKELLDVEFLEMCYVGDNTKKDFIAPEKLGMKVIWFRNPDGLYCRVE